MVAKVQKIFGELGDVSIKFCKYKSCFYKTEFPVKILLWRHTYEVTKHIIKFSLFFKFEASRIQT